MATEKELDRAFEDAVKNRDQFRDWFLRKTRLGPSYPHYLWSRSNHPWGPVKLLLPNEAGALQMVERQGETDVLLVFESKDTKERLGIHIENKRVSGSFTQFQPEVCAARADLWVGKAEYKSYNVWETVLVAPTSFYKKHIAEAKKFMTFIPHEEIALHIPLFEDG